MLSLMPALPPLTKELQLLSEAELLDRANACMLRGSETGPADAGLWLEAQLCLNERSGRQMLRYTRWMTILTGVVTFLTVVVTATTIWMAFRSCP